MGGAQRIDEPRLERGAGGHRIDADQPVLEWLSAGVAGAARPQHGRTQRRRAAGGLRQPLKSIKTRKARTPGFAG